VVGERWNIQRSAFFALFAFKSLERILPFRLGSNTEKFVLTGCRIRSMSKPMPPFIAENQLTA